MNKKLNHLVIVESPSKARTLSKFLDSEYVIEASVGHVRDLPKKELGIDIENSFKPTYVISPDKKKVISSLKTAIKNAETLYLATDLDREGEAISWHLLELLKPTVPVKRLVFHEITKAAINDALNHTREIDRSLVDAQETRRIIDRLFGFQVSRQLWFNVKGGLSAGRVQSPAIKIIVDREKLRMAFIAREYWDINAEFKAKNGKFSAKLRSLDGQIIANGKDFDRTTGELTNKKAIVLDKERTNRLSEDLKDNQWLVNKIEQKNITTNPYPPFITSTLQQAGIRKLRMNSQQVMRVAQKLYENGYITYMRTDSVQLSSEAINASRNAVRELFGKEYLPDKARVYKSKVKNAQEAHEAVRPAGSKFKNPQKLRDALGSDEWKLYKLIWERTIASQMKSARILQTTADISDGTAVFRANGKVVEFPGYLKVYANDNPDEEMLPRLTENENVLCETMNPKQHHTKPSARYNEASLIKEMESLGIGRPSTYASIMGTIQKRGYVNKTKGSLVPTFTAFAVVHFLEKYFDDLVDLQFTAKLEDRLDQISRSELNQTQFLDSFYFGHEEHPGLKTQLEQDFDKNNIKIVFETNDLNGDTVQVKIGRYGLYIQKDNINATIPDEIAPIDLTPELVEELIKKKNEAPKEIAIHQNTGEPIFLHEGRFGPYLKMEKKMKSLLPGMAQNDVTPETAQKIMSLPRKLGRWQENGEEIVADIGRYGPYIKCGKETRKVADDEPIINITFERAVELLSTKGKTTGPVVLENFGTDPETKANIELKDGQYGAYVTDGKINATIPKGTDPSSLTLESAKNLIAEKKAKGPTKRRFRKRK